MLVPSALTRSPELYVRQVRELAELFGFETRNKYAIFTPDQVQVGFAAEQQTGLLGALVRQVLGHWRTFEIHFFGANREPLFRAVHPFRFFFQRLDVYGNDGTLIGSLQQRWSIFRKCFDVLGPDGRLLLEMRSGFFSFWSFPFFRQGQQVAAIQKKWSGALTELFLDKDNFRVQLGDSSLPENVRVLILAAAVFVDLQYFEQKANA